MKIVKKKGLLRVNKAEVVCPVCRAIAGYWNESDGFYTVDDRGDKVNKNEDRLILCPDGCGTYIRIPHGAKCLEPINVIPPQRE